MALTKQKFFDLIIKSLDNAESLISDADLLKENGRLARAYTLYQLATEEVGKANLTFGFILFDDYDNVAKQNDFLKEFKDHKIKTKKAIYSDLKIAMIIPDKKLGKTLIERLIKQSENISEINNYKNYSLYVSLKDDCFKKPSELINAELVDDICFTATFRHKTTKEFLDEWLKNFDSLSEQMKMMDFTDIENKISKDISEIMNNGGDIE